MSCSTGSTIARASSGSRSSSSSVEPLMSANSAVTVLRSPSVNADASAGAVTRTAGAADSTGVDSAAAALSEVPQSEQNVAPNALSEPQFEHRFDKGLPHSAQNFLP